MVKVDVYYSRVCGLCTKTLDFLRDRGVTFTAHAIEWDDEKDEFVDSVNSHEMIKRCGEKVDFVPQIFIGDVHIKGWKKLKPMIESGEIDNLLPKSEREVASSE